LNQEQKLYYYVDETGQDAAVNAFVVVAIASTADQDEFRRRLTEVEDADGTGHRK